MLRLAEAKNSTVSRGVIVTVSRNNGLDWGPSIVMRALSATETSMAYLGEFLGWLLGDLVGFWNWLGDNCPQAIEG